MTKVMCVLKFIWSRRDGKCVDLSFGLGILIGVFIRISIFMFGFFVF